MDLYKLTAHELHDKLVSKEISSVELTENVYSRIDEVEDKVQAYVTLDKENAMAQAAKVDAKIAAGEAIAPLAGIPGAIKDNICTKGLLTTCSSKMLSNVVPIYDAHVIKKLRADDAIFTGKTNMDEFAMGSTTESSYFHKTYNPWNLERVPGGSSGGSAAAIAAGEAIWSLGSDTGGSIRQPASFCGCVGLKPSYGRVSRYGVTAFASSLDQVGPLTKTVEDAAILLRTIAGADPHDQTCLDRPVPDYRAAARAGSLRGVKIGVPREYFVEGTDPEVMAQVRHGIALAEKAGAEIHEISLPHTEYAIAVYYICATAEASANLARFDGIRYGYREVGPEPSIQSLYDLSRTHGFGPEVKRRILLGTYVLSSGYYDAYYNRALKARTLVRRDFLEAFRHVDAIFCPASPTPAFPLNSTVNDPLQAYLCDAFTIPANLAGICGISIPCGRTATLNLPVGLQILAPAFAEERLLSIAAACEREFAS